MPPLLHMTTPARKAALVLLIVCGGAAILAVLLANDSPEPSQSKETTRQRALNSLPYLDYTPTKKKDRAKRGVTQHLEAKTSRGLNVYKSRNEERAHLMRMNGDIVHTWTIPAQDIKHVEVDDSGNLYAVEKDGRLIKLDWNSAVIWDTPGRFHHDVHIHDPDALYTLTREIIELPHDLGPLPIIDDAITVVSHDGEIIKRLSIYALFGDDLDPRRLDAVAKRWSEIEDRDAVRFDDSSMYDLFHSNSIEVITQDIEGFARRGQVLISIRELDTIAVVDLATQEVVWRWGPGEVQAQHQPTLLENGHLLIFDNGTRRRWSRVLELDPVTRTIEWEYTADPKDTFFSAIRGGSERLPNGNTLITESDRGRVFEVSPSGDILWEFWNPEMRGTKRAAIYRMDRLPRQVIAQLPSDDAQRATLHKTGYMPVQDEPATTLDAPE